MPFLSNVGVCRQWCGVALVFGVLGLTACGGGADGDAAGGGTGSGVVVAQEVPSIESTVASLPSDSELQQTRQSL
jgi:hypothetical protein